MEDPTKTLKTKYCDVRWLPKAAEVYADKSTLIFGGSGTGKTKIIEEILFLIRDHIPNYLVLTDINSRKFYTSKLPSRCVQNDLTKEKISQIWSRQSNLTECCNIANDINNIKKLYERIATRSTEARITLFTNIQAAEKARIEKSDFNYATKRDFIARIEDMYMQNLKVFYKNAIQENIAQLRSITLTGIERITLEYLNVNPKLCIILDDVTDKFEKWMGYFKRSEVNPFESIFFQGRHNNITIIFAAHDDKVIPTELRKSARLTIFTSSQALITAINRKGNAFSKNEQKLAEQIALEIFGDDSKPGGEKKFQKLCYVKDETPPFRYTVAQLYADFTLGCSALYELADKMPKKDTHINQNPFAKHLLD